MIKAVLFDIDGVLVDSHETAIHFVSDILSELGHRATRQEIEPILHYPLVWILKKLTGRELTEELQRLPDITASVQYRSDLLAEFPHTKEMLQALHGKYILGLVTSRKKDGLQRYYDFSRNEDLFSLAVTVDDIVNHKPHPEALLLAAKRLGLRPHECVFVGDSLTDIEAAHAAGMKSVLFGGKSHKDADAVINDLAELPPLISMM